MGIADLKQAFADEVGPKYAVQIALLGYQRDEDGKEWQVLQFRGIGPGGVQFDVSSEPHSPNADPVEVARATAQEFLQTAETTP